MRVIKYRQPRFLNGQFHSWHYWGFVERGFIGPDCSQTGGIQVANENSQQFTGRTDKDGKEVYQGDVFNCIYHSDGHTDHHYIVIWGDEMSDFRLRRVGNPCRQDQVYQHLRDVARYPMIGNVHENPELLG